VRSNRRGREGKAEKGRKKVGLIEHQKGPWMAAQAKNQDRKEDEDSNIGQKRGV